MAEGWLVNTMESVNFGAFRAVGLGTAALVVATAGCAGSSGTSGARSPGGAAGTAHAAAVQVLEPGAPQVSAEVLRTTVEARVGNGDLGPARVERAWRWRPVAGEELIA